MKTFWSIEPLLQFWRINKIWPYLPKKGKHLDLGCDNPPVLLEKLAEQIETGIGLDIIKASTNKNNLDLLQAELKKKLNFEDNTFESVSMLAVLEHVKYPEAIVSEIKRVLKPKGVFVFTVPAPPLAHILPLMGTLGFVRKEMIDQHENYFTIEKLQRMLQKTGFKKFKVKHFALGLNTLGVAYK